MSTHCFEPAVPSHHPASLATNLLAKRHSALRRPLLQVEDYDLAKSLKLQIDHMRWVLHAAA